MSSTFIKIIAGILIVIALNLYINLERTDIFTMLSPAIHEDQGIAHLFFFLLAFFSNILILHVSVHLHLIISFLFLERL